MSWISREFCSLLSSPWLIPFLWFTCASIWSLLSCMHIFTQNKFRTNPSSSWGLPRRRGLGHWVNWNSKTSEEKTLLRKNQNNTFSFSLRFLFDFSSIKLKRKIIIQNLQVDEVPNGWGDRACQYIGIQQPTKKVRRENSEDNFDIHSPLFVSTLPFSFTVFLFSQQKKEAYKLSRRLRFPRDEGIGPLRELEYKCLTNKYEKDM